MPCPEDSADTSTTEAVACCPNPGASTTQQCHTRRVRDLIDLAPVGSHPLGNFLPKGSRDNVVTVSSPASGTTYARFCQTDLAHGFNCYSATSVDSKQRNMWATADAEQGNDKTRPWHRITLGSVSGGSCTGTRGGTDSVDYGPAVRLQERWCFADDWNYWLTGPMAPKIPLLALDLSACTTTPIDGGAPCGPTNLPLAGTCLQGTFWRDSDTEVGHTVDTLTTSGSNVLVGLHASVDTIADHYFDVAPDRPNAYCPIPSNLMPADPPGSPLVPQPVLLWQAQSPQRAFDIRPVPETELVLESALGGLAALEDNGTGVAVGNNGACNGSSASPGLTSAFKGHVWVSASEPDPRVGPISGDIMAVALASDGTTLVNAAVASNDVLFAATELPGGGGTGIGGTTFPDPPSPRRDFTAVFSRAARGVYVLGGNDAVTQAPLHDLWFQPLGAPWSRLSFDGYEPGQVMAATFAFGDLKLWVLDAVAADDQRPTMRLARLDPRGGHAEVVASFRRTGNIDHWFLSVDRDGGVLLSATKAHRNFTARFNVTGSPPRATAIFRQHGALAFAPIVDLHSYAFVVTRPSGVFQIVRRADLSHCNGNAEPDCGAQKEPSDDDLQGLF